MAIRRCPFCSEKIPENKMLLHVGFKHLSNGRHRRHVMEITQATATAALVLQSAAADENPLPMPHYVTTSDTGTIGLQMATFEDVAIWAEYIGAEYSYEEVESEIAGKPGQIGLSGFANCRHRYADADHGEVYLHVYHNEVLRSDPQSEPLFPLPATE